MLFHVLDLDVQLCPERHQLCPLAVDLFLSALHLAELRLGAGHVLLLGGDRLRRLPVLLVQLLHLGEGVGSARFNRIDLGPGFGE